MSVTRNSITLQPSFLIWVNSIFFFFCWHEWRSNVPYHFCLPSKLFLLVICEFGNELCHHFPCLNLTRHSAPTRLKLTVLTHLPAITEVLFMVYCDIKRKVPQLNAQRTKKTSPQVERLIILDCFFLFGDLIRHTLSNEL